MGYHRGVLRCFFIDFNFFLYSAKKFFDLFKDLNDTFKNFEVSKGKSLEKILKCLGKKRDMKKKA